MDLHICLYLGFDANGDTLVDFHKLECYIQNKVEEKYLAVLFAIVRDFSGRSIRSEAEFSIQMRELRYVQEFVRLISICNALEEVHQYCSLLQIVVALHVKC